MPLLVHLGLVAFAKASLWPFQNHKRTHRVSIGSTIYLGIWNIIPPLWSSCRLRHHCSKREDAHVQVYMYYHMCILGIYVYNIYIHICILHVCIYIYTYIYRERERVHWCTLWSHGPHLNSPALAALGKSDCARPQGKALNRWTAPPLPRSPGRNIPWSPLSCTALEWSKPHDGMLMISADGMVRSSRMLAWKAQAMSGN